ncbi:MAG: hypothetical protein GY786_03710 [Proteobacteria bacterium]|nr:hypothetical protein [Pseudomonadota bacterium]
MSRLILLLIVITVIPSVQIAAQDFYGEFEFEYLENERSISQTGSSTVDEHRIKKIGKGNLNYWNFHLIGNYNTIDSSTSIESEKASFHDSQNHLRAVLTFGPMALVHLASESEEVYHYQDDTTQFFNEDESKSFEASGLGFALNSLVFGYFPEGEVNWKYDFLYTDTKVYNENIKYNVNISQIIRQSQRGPGIYFDFHYTRLKSIGAQNSRDGEFESLDTFGEIGWIAANGSVIWYGDSRISINSDSVLESSSDTLEEKTTVERNSVGFSIPIDVLNDLVIKKLSLHKKTEVIHKNYIAEKLVGEDTFSVGLDLKERDLLIELKISNTYYERNIGQTSLITLPSDYSVDDTLVGFSFNYRFGAN